MGGVVLRETLRFPGPRVTLTVLTWAMVQLRLNDRPAGHGSWYVPGSRSRPESPRIALIWSWVGLGLVRQVIWPAGGGMNVYALPGGLTAAIRHPPVPAGIVSTADPTHAA